METLQGTCRYCGQILMFEEADIPESLDDKCNLCDETATRKCNCDKANDYRLFIARKEKTFKNIEAAFQKNSEVTEYLMKEAVVPMMQYDIAKVTVDIGNGLKGTMSMTSKGVIKVKASYTKEAEFIE